MSTESPAREQGRHRQGGGGVGENKKGQRGAKARVRGTDIQRTKEKREGSLPST